MTKTCEHKSCTRRAVVSNLEYFPGEWLCTYHGNKATKEGRQKRKYGDRNLIK
jgi:hypothetical protein